MIPRWFLYVQGFAMLLIGASLIAMRPRKKGDSLLARYVNLGTMWALVCCVVGAGLLAMALDYWSGPLGLPPPPAHARHR